MGQEIRHPAALGWLAAAADLAAAVAAVAAWRAGWTPTAYLVAVPLVVLAAALAAVVWTARRPGRAAAVFGAFAFALALVIGPVVVSASRAIWPGE